MQSMFELGSAVTLVTDGSGSTGIGGFIPEGEWASYTMATKYDQHHHDLDRRNADLSSTWVELVALLGCLMAFRTTLRGKGVLWWTDSQCSVLAWANHRSSARSINIIFGIIDGFLARNDIKLHPRWHRRTYRHAQLADMLSKSQLDPFCAQSPSIMTARRVVPHTKLDRAIARSISPSTRQ